MIAAKLACRQLPCILDGRTSVIDSSTIMFRYPRIKAVCFALCMAPPTLKSQVTTAHSMELWSIPQAP